MKLIVCVDQNWAIGKNNQLLFRFPEDQKFFKNTTMNSTVIMGRKTYESIPEIHGEKLKGRNKIVLTSNKAIEYKHRQDKSYSIINSITDDFIKSYKDRDDVFVIGGAEIYKILAPYCNDFFITHIKDQVDSSDKLIYLPKEARPDKSFSKNIILDNNNLTIIFYKR